jgi:hypothetical protein
MGIANQPAEFAGAVPVKRPADPVAVFTARCAARATLYAAGEFELTEAVDPLQASAVACGLLEMIGQDAVQAIMAAAFEPVRDDLAGQDDEVPGDEYEGLSSTFARACEAADRKHADEQQSINNRGELKRGQHCGIPISVQQTAEWLFFQAKDPKRFETWLLEHSECQRQAIVAHIERKKARR